MSSNVTHAEMNEIIEINCTEPGNNKLAIYYPDNKCATSSQCTLTGACYNTSHSICSCCVQPTPNCNAPAGQLSFTVLMSQLTFFGTWSCRNGQITTSNCTTVVIKQYGRLRYCY